jgi:hypothetical protein
MDPAPVGLIHTFFSLHSAIHHIPRAGRKSPRGRRRCDAWRGRGGVSSDNINRSRRVARALRAGIVHVNQHDEDDITVPFAATSKSATAATNPCMPSTNTPSARRPGYELIYENDCVLSVS